VEVHRRQYGVDAGARAADHYQQLHPSVRRTSRAKIGELLVKELWTCFLASLFLLVCFVPLRQVERRPYLSSRCFSLETTQRLVSPARAECQNGTRPLSAADAGDAFISCDAVSPR
jgi:hypothetical protein